MYLRILLTERQTSLPHDEPQPALEEQAVRSGQADGEERDGALAIAIDAGLGEPGRQLGDLLQKVGSVPEAVVRRVVHQVEMVGVALVPPAPVRTGSGKRNKGVPRSEKLRLCHVFGGSQARRTVGGRVPTTVD